MFDERKLHYKLESHIFFISFLTIAMFNGNLRNSLTRQDYIQKNILFVEHEYASIQKFFFFIGLYIGTFTILQTIR